MIYYQFLQMMQSSISVDSSERQLELIPIMQKLVELDSSCKKIKKTLIVYDVYKKREDVSLGNLHAFAQNILDQTLKLNVQSKETKKKIKLSYSIDPSTSSSIQRKCVSNDGSYPADESFQDYIGIYEKGDLRVIGLPIQKDLIDNSQGSKFYKELEEEKKRIYQQGKLNNNRNTAMKEWQFEQQRRIADHVGKQYPRFVKIVQLETIISILISKTQQITVAGLIDAQRKRFKHIQGYQQQFKGLFAGKNIKPQFILHSHQIDEDSDEQDDDEESKTFLESKLTTSIFTIDSKNQVDVQKRDMWNQQHFFPGSELRTVVYDNEKKANGSLSKNANDFCEDMRQLVKLSAGFIVQTINDIYSALETSSSQKSIYSASRSIKQIEQMFSLEKRSILKVESLKEYSSLENSKPMNLDQKIQIPEEIKYLFLANQFQYILNPFLEQYSKQELTLKNNQSALLAKWQSLLKRLYELMQSVYGATYKEQMQRQFDFACFLLAASRLLKQAIGVQASVGNQFKVLFQQVTAKRNQSQGQVLRHIIADTSPIPKNMPLTYYNMYLNIILSNQKYDLQKETKYRECQIREVRAYVIASKYIYDEAKIVEAIKDYAHILIETSTFSERKKLIVSLQDVQKKIAKLLIIIGMEDKAAEIYLKNRNIGLAYKALSFLKIKHQGDSRAELLIDWGKRFERQLQYELALSCYREAYDCAKAFQFAKESVQCKVDCRKKIRNGDPEDVTRQFNKFISPETKNLNEFISSKSLLNLFESLKRDLNWDEMAEMAILRKSQNATIQTSQSSLSKSSQSYK